MQSGYNPILKAIQLGEMGMASVLLERRQDNITIDEVGILVGVHNYFINKRN